MSHAPLRIIQISDSHLFSNPEKVLLGVPTQKSFEAVLDLIKREAGTFDLIIHSGDLAQDYSHPTYIRIAEMLESFNVPVYCIPGNHDKPEIMAQLYPRGLVKIDKHIITDNWQIILLDSHKPNAVEGYLSPLELQYLEQCLLTYPDHRAIAFVHHQPVSVGCHWLDKLGLTNAKELWGIISRFPQVNAVVFGHVHQEFEQVVNGIKCFSAPATCFQFMRKQNHFGIEDIAPGYRWIHLYDDGRIETGVKRATQYIGKFEPNAKGY